MNYSTPILSEQREYVRCFLSATACINLSCMQRLPTSSQAVISHVTHSRIPASLHQDNMSTVNMCTGAIRQEQLSTFWAERGKTSCMSFLPAPPHKLESVPTLQHDARVQLNPAYFITCISKKRTMELGSAEISSKWLASVPTAASCMCPLVLVGVAEARSSLLF